MARSDFKTVDEYISSFPQSTQVILQALREVIKKEVPGVTEMISYQIAAYKLNGKNVIYFAGFKNHVSLYPIHPDDVPFGDELAEYVSGKATLQFPLDKPIPFDLVKKIVAFKAVQIPQSPNGY